MHSSSEVEKYYRKIIDVLSGKVTD